MCLTTKKWKKAEDIYDYLFKKDVKLKAFDDAGQDILYGDCFL